MLTQGTRWVRDFCRSEDGQTAVETAVHYVNLANTKQGFALAMIAGAAITLLTWMQHNTDQYMVSRAASITDDTQENVV